MYFHIFYIDFHKSPFLAEFHSFISNFTNSSSPTASWTIRLRHCIGRSGMWEKGLVLGSDLRGIILQLFACSLPILLFLKRHHLTGMKGHCPNSESQKPSLLLGVRDGVKWQAERVSPQRTLHRLLRDENIELWGINKSKKNTSLVFGDELYTVDP